MNLPERVDKTQCGGKEGRLCWGTASGRVKEGCSLQIRPPSTSRSVWSVPAAAMHTLDELSTTIRLG